MFSEEVALFTAEEKMLFSEEGTFPGAHKWTKHPAAHKNDVYESDSDCVSATDGSSHAANRRPHLSRGAYPNIGLSFLESGNVWHLTGLHEGFIRAEEKAKRKQEVHNPYTKKIVLQRDRSHSINTQNR